MRNNNDLTYGSNPPVADSLNKQEVSRLQYVQTGYGECNLGERGGNVTTRLSTGEVEDVDLYLQTPYAFRGVESEYLIWKKNQYADDIANNPTR